MSTELAAGSSHNVRFYLQHGLVSAQAGSRRDRRQWSCLAQSRSFPAVMFRPLNALAGASAHCSGSEVDWRGLGTTP